MSSRHVRKWVIAAPVIGLVMLGCGNSTTTFTGLGGGGGNGGTSPTGSAGSEQGGAGGSGSSAGGNGGTGDGGTSSGGTGGSSNTDPEIDYEPVGIGDPWFFSSATDMEAFTVQLKSGVTGAATWNPAGELRLPLTFTAGDLDGVVHVTAPWDMVANKNTPLDLTGRVLRARVKVASGATASGGVQAFAQSRIPLEDNKETWDWKNGPWSNISDLGSWRDIEMDFDTATVPNEIMRIGIQVYATSAGSVELIVDDLRLEPKPPEPQPDGGTVDPPVDGDAGAPDGGGELGYEPVGLGDPWYFDDEAEMSEFGFAPGWESNATETHSWDSGKVHVVVTCTKNGDSIEMGFMTPWDGTVNTADLTGRVMKARVRLADGATAGAAVQGFGKSDNWSWASAGWTDGSNLASYADVTFPMSEAVDPADVQQFGVQLYCTSAGTVELIVDDIRLEPDN